MKEDVIRLVEFTSEMIAKNASDNRRFIEFKKREREAETEERLITNPKAAEFLKAIDLGDSSDEEKPD